MHNRPGIRRKVRRRGAPAKPKRRRVRQEGPVRRRAAGGFETLIPFDGSEDFFAFTAWLGDREEASGSPEHRRRRPESFQGSRESSVAVSAMLHVLLVVFLLVEPSLPFLNLGRTPEQNVVAELDGPEPLVLFMEEPPAEPPVTALPVVPEEESPEIDDRLLIPKAALPPPPDKRGDFMNDLPFSEGNTDEFYTEEEVKEPGSEGEPVETEETPEVAREESGEAETSTEPVEGEEEGNDGTETARIDPGELGDLLFGMPSLKEEERARRDIRPPEPRVIPGERGEGGENGTFTDIRRFLAGAQFHNPEGGLVSNTGNTLYYNDKGANFVPWIHRLLAEVRRNWLIPDSVRFARGHVAVRISVARDGSLLGLEVLIPSGVSGFDNAAVGAIRAARLLPLPADYPDDRFEIILVFWYNERPYDLFR